MRYPVDTFSVKRVCVVACSFCFSVVEEELFHLLFSLFDFMDCLVGTSVLCGSLVWLTAFLFAYWFFAKAHHLPKISCLRTFRPPNCPLCRKNFVSDQIKKLHVDRLEPDKAKQIDFLNQLILGWCEMNDQQFEVLLSPVQNWLASKDVHEVCFPSSPRPFLPGPPLRYGWTLIFLPFFSFL